MALMKEFKEFALKGNVIDLAVAVVVGGAFAKIVTSFVNDILMPPLGLLLGKHDFADSFVNLSGGQYESLAAAKAAGAATINYGLFTNAIVDFIIVAFAIFIAIKQMNKLNRKPAEAATPNMRDCPQCLSAIPVAAKRCKFCTQAV